MSIDFGNDIYEEPIVTKTFLAEDVQEGSLRPKNLSEYIGQDKDCRTGRRSPGYPGRGTGPAGNTCL